MESLNAVGRTPDQPPPPPGVRGTTPASSGVGPAATFATGPAAGGPALYRPPAVAVTAEPDVAWASSSLLEAASGRIVATLDSGQPVIMTVLGTGSAPADPPALPSAGPPPRAVPAPAPAKLPLAKRGLG